MDLLLSTSLILLWAGFNIFRDRSRGASWRMTRRFWGFFVVKTMLPLIALFLFVFEFGGVTQLGVTGGCAPRQRTARRVVLLLRHRHDPHLGLARPAWALPRLPRHMRQPLRIGVPGQILLETAGQEVMCPQGHGSVYTYDSVSARTCRTAGWDSPNPSKPGHHPAFSMRARMIAL